ncbi:TLC domain-containing protein 1 isoform X2 [Festucalex cinctus]
MRVELSEGEPERDTRLPFRGCPARNVFTIGLPLEKTSCEKAASCTRKKSVLVWPETLRDLHYYHTPLSYLLVCISTGYFVQDTAEIILMGHARAAWEFLIHHALVICCFLYTLYTHLYVAGAVVTLFVELNSVTLHLRLLLKLAGATSSTAYRVNKMLNIWTFVAIRLAAQFYLTWYVIKNYSELHNAAFFMCALMTTNIMMLMYLCRLIRSDFLRHVGGKEYAVRNGTHNSKKFLSD